MPWTRKQGVSFGKRPQDNPQVVALSLIAPEDDSLIDVASGMKSPIWPGGVQQSRILVYGLR
jgi:hypothetical protein